METARDHIRELTALFLGEEDSVVGGRAGDGGSGGDGGGAGWGGGEDDSSGSPGDARGGVTLLVCGHLPVMTGPWVSQYGAQCAESVGPIGLVRLEGGRCAVEIFGLGRDHRRQPGEGQLEVVKRLSSHVRRWMVAIDERDIGASVRAGAASLLVLTSSERPAVIRAFELAKVGWHRASSTSGLDVGVVVAGAAPAAVEVVAQTLSEASVRHLDEPLAVRDAVPALAPIEDCSKMLFDEAMRADVSDVIAAILAHRDSGDDPSSDGVDDGDEPTLRLTSLDDPASSEQEGFYDHRRRPGRAPVRMGPAPSAPSLKERFAPRRPPVSTERLESVSDVSHQASAEDVVPPIWSSPPATDPPTPRSSPDLDLVPPIWTPSPAEDLTRPSASLEPPLASLVDGLQPLSWSPPSRIPLELAIDQAGRLQLLGRDALPWMAAGKAWLKDLPAELLAAAGIDPESRHAPGEHLFTTRAPDVAHLHGAGIRLYLLDISGESWRVWPLNDDGGSRSV